MGNLKKLHHLKNSNVHSLEEMPKGLGKLTCLVTLCRFVVGKDSGSRLRELKSLTHLQGRLQISKLENVKDVGDASEAQLNSKVNLEALWLEWRRDWNICDMMEPVSEADSKIEIRVLDMLKPHKKLEELTIDGYGGTKFPIWLGDSSFSKLMRLRFDNCGTSISLPSIGQLPFLKDLVISRMGRVKSMGPEIYGNSCSVPFPLLETLCFEDMQEWEEWIPRGSGREFDVVFPKLRMLSLVSCSKMQGTLPECLPSLEKLVIIGCEQLLVRIQCHPALSALAIYGCKKMEFSSPIDLSSLKSVHLGDMANEMVLAGLFEQRLPKLENLKIENVREQTYLWPSENRLLEDINSLNQLRIWGCSQLLPLVAEEEHDQQQPELPCRLQFLELSDCEGLTKLPQALLTLSSLTDMSINGCASLVSFPQAVLPSQLRSVVIKECDALESFPEAWMQNSSASLESLEIRNCGSLTYIGRIQLPPSLKRLIIFKCDNLRTLTGEQDICSGSSGCTSLTSSSSENELPAALERHQVSYCSKLALLSRNGSLPQALKFLQVSYCSKLESLGERLDTTSLEEIRISGLENLKSLPAGLHNLHHLQKITVDGCPNLESFPEEGLPFTKLTSLQIFNCKNLKALPNCMHNLTSLLHLKIGQCPSLESFPEDGFPTNLQSLEFESLKISKPLFEWGLNRFTSLRKLTIVSECPDLLSSSRFPASLTELQILDMPNLKSLSSIVQNFPSLEILGLYNCPKLKHFSKQGLPKSLLELTIDECPLIEKRCRKDEGKYWPMITHIPRVQINDRSVFEED